MATKPWRKVRHWHFNKKICQQGPNSSAIVLPVTWLRDLGWPQGQEVRMEYDKANQRIIIRNKLEVIEVDE